ncbi:hypothetical protein [Reichenbachiella sp. MALMAid0571]|uniref:hypothetical protein n=1 Tax=Reichenbachiella sp. MALMAid0571 TaxID=3143939 RepID=UPI0032DEC645
MVSITRNTKVSFWYLILLLACLFQLSGCTLYEDKYNVSRGTYWSNMTYSIERGKKFRFDQNEHLFELSDTLITHSTIVNNNIQSRSFPIKYVTHKGMNESIYYATKYHLLFHLDKKNNYLKVYNRKSIKVNSTLNLMMTYTRLKKVEQIEDKYAVRSLPVASSK